MTRFDDAIDYALSVLGAAARVYAMLAVPTLFWWHIAKGWNFILEIWATATVAYLSWIVIYRLIGGRDAL